MKHDRIPGGIADLILRLGIGSVFLIFGIDKFIHPLYWSGWTPTWVYNSILVTPSVFQNSHAVIEIVTGVLLIIGLFTTLASILGSLQLIGIIIILTITSGWSDILTRDIGLLSALIALIFLNHQYSLDNLITYLMRDHTDPMQDQS